jgi:hypothetical protein
MFQDMRIYHLCNATHSGLDSKGRLKYSNTAMRCTTNYFGKIMARREQAAWNNMLLHFGLVDTHALGEFHITSPKRFSCKVFDMGSL